MYVSCRYGPPPDETMPNSQQMIVCVDDQEQEWWVSPDCQVGDWLAYNEAGGTVDPQDPDQVTTGNILNAPDNLTGGPTLAEVFNVHE
jgi:hypothetical protein